MLLDPLEYARRFVYLWQSSPVAGAFDEEKYRFVIKPLMSLIDMMIKDTVIYGPTQSFKTVLFQIATAYRLDMIRKSVLAVAQSDDDAKEFSTIKLTPFLERISALESTLKNLRYAKTLNQWLWANHELIISGPGLNAQQSKSVTFLHTDESHRYCLEYPGALTALNDRMGGRWDRHGLHVTTAPDIGTEIDLLHKKGGMNEWHVRCINCDKLFQPLWLEGSRELYNGHEVFHWKEQQSETATLDSIRIVCPHCDSSPIEDTPINRKEMDEGADYIPDNPEHDKSVESYRWNAFAPRWKKWRDLLQLYRAALESAKLGEMQPYRNWITKQEVRVWKGDFPSFGSSMQGRDYSVSDIDIEVIKENRTRTCSFDIQEGVSGSGGFHLWCLAEEWELGGWSRRICYKRLDTWAEAREFQLYHRVPTGQSAADFGEGEREREIFGKCAEYRWIAFKSGDFDNFPHHLPDAKTGSVTTIQLPYSETRIENPLSGKQRVGPKQPEPYRKGVVPRGFCISLLWSIGKIYPILYALKSSEGEEFAKKYYGIATDINPEYTEQLHSYVPRTVYKKSTSVPTGVEWVRVRKMDHAFPCSAQGLVLAIRLGFFPMSEPRQPSHLLASAIIDEVQKKLDAEKLKKTP